MALEFKLPDIGEGLTEGEVTKWLVKEGDVVAADQPMVEVLTDKATVEITSPRAGTIQKIMVPDGTKVPVGTVIVVIGDGAGGGAAPARERGIDLRAVPGTGPNGRITRTDLEGFGGDGGAQAPTAGAAPAARPAAAPAMVEVHAPTTAEGDEHVPLRGLRGKIAEQMLR